ncbi:GNAT family N-acetyltransferase [Paramicrobacterium fandaimingii]|uniref:GNAT family N-acetyltransferase n=1 Tax=Paramicrobacterium fandaimingii TaxID=2708079 RepID=UPI00141F8C1C|nr:GNAT family N-acetyltransferase [Microbacterium fandaimingii]
MGNKCEVHRFDARWAAGVASLCKELGWHSYSDARVAKRGYSAPGVSTFVAVSNDEVIGFAQVLSDGIVQAFLAQVGVSEKHRRQGIARALVIAAFQNSGAQRLDLITDDAHEFYRSFAHREKAGFRIYPDYAG